MHNVMRKDDAVNSFNMRYESTKNEDNSFTVKVAGTDIAVTAPSETEAVRKLDVVVRDKMTKGEFGRKV
jgi:hypothetical protein